ncbi:MAG: molybdopterin molybdotransferase MoeA, partial [Thermoleophilia bacterium]|nr:molybdopterin molybdotransferase MoeA [Thermoleophilia bacterium]
AADLPGTLPIVGRVAAGRPAARPLGPGEAMEISTGGAVPEGADAVVPVEYVVVDGNRVEFAQGVPAGANVRPRGGDVAAGDVVVPAGTRITAAQVGALAAAGVAELRCGSVPRVVVVTTGSELAAPGEPLAPGQVYDANGLMLAAALAPVGADIEVAPAVADDEAAHRAALERGLGADVLVTSGGVSVGPHDLVRRIEAELGVEEVFWRVAIKPGKPVSFGVRDGTLVFGLPGNPVSALVGCELFVKPALRALQGLADPRPRFEPGRLAAPLRRTDARDELVRARTRLDRDGVWLEPLRGQESHMIVRAAAADALVHVPRGEGELSAGAIVSWLRLGQP